MSEKPKSAKQVAAQEKRAAAVQWLKDHGKSAAVPLPELVMKLQAEGKAEDEILAAVNARKSNANTKRAATLAAKKEAKTAAKTAAKAAPAKANAPKVGNAAPPKANNTTAKVRTAAQQAADQRMKNLKAKFNQHNIKYGGPSQKYFTEQKKAGKNETEIFEEMKGKFPKFEVTEAGEKKAVVAKRVTVKKANNGPKVVARVNNGSAVTKGSYICERCQFVGTDKAVANNGTRKNKNKNNGPVNYTYNEQGY